MPSEAASSADRVSTGGVDEIHGEHGGVRHRIAAALLPCDVTQYARSAIALSGHIFVEKELWWSAVKPLTQC